MTDPDWVTFEEIRATLPNPGVTENGLHHSPPTVGPNDWYAEFTPLRRWSWGIRYRTPGFRSVEPSAVTWTLAGAKRKARRELRRRNAQERRPTWYYPG